MQSTQREGKRQSVRYFDISISPVLQCVMTAISCHILITLPPSTTPADKLSILRKPPSVFLTGSLASQCYCSVRKLEMINRLDYFTTTINYTCSPVCLRFSINKVIIGSRAGQGRVGQYYPGFQVTQLFTFRDFL